VSVDQFSRKKAQKAQNMKNEILQRSIRILIVFAPSAPFGA
jgi:hypothetical protein